MKKITQLSFLSLATLPLLKENLNSMVIILCCCLTIINYFSEKKLDRKSLLMILTYTIPFWIALIYDVITASFDFKNTIRCLPFFIFPFLYYLKPVYIGEQIKKRSIIVFQISTIIQCVIYLIVFFLDNPFDKLFYISPENIPFFRVYALSNYVFQIHATYFSAFLLMSFIFSFNKLFIVSEKKILHFLNVLTTVFFIFLLSSKIIFLSLVISFLAISVFYISKNNKKHMFFSTIGFLMLFIVLLYPTKNNLIYKRFNQVKIEYKKPIVGNYHNSTNIRVAIIRCSLKLIKEVPLLGYGNNLQDELNQCYKENNDSDFYKINVYNTHNYYVNLILYGGWLYFLIFIFYFIFIFIKVKHSFIGVLLLTQFLFINLTENYLSRHYGIVLFAYFMTFLMFIHNKNDSEFK